ncbi:response regulator transcription factor [Jeotgalibacillus sp. R-1-5s-1]|uniref:response regulator transcription factor n=1 Tax=Jeotgalibacillus sp. R-1-5s-1 TaxID=2555897 RepID=UPI00106946F7|nr:response regulator transcription factor [Jeotgalibacillus sp. R-1-5s-1]TFD92263.1 response regulator transcription factor [Jeotgalibacillus sp. R-1-5s-1]
MGKIVIVEDDIFLREELQNIFEKEGYTVYCIRSFDHPVEDIIFANPCLILLDLNLPNYSGFDICRALKAKGVGPVLVLTSRDQLSDELHAFGLGADDYLTKPCHPQRLIARVDKLIRLYSNRHILLDAGDFQIDDQSNVLYTGTGSITLSKNEAVMLKALVHASPSVVRKEELFHTLWGSSDYVDENILQVNMTRLRKTLDGIGLPNRIKTIRGIGYQLLEDDSL